MAWRVSSALGSAFVLSRALARACALWGGARRPAGALSIMFMTRTCPQPRYTRKHQVKLSRHFIDSLLLARVPFKIIERPSVALATDCIHTLEHASMRTQQPACK